MYTPPKLYTDQWSDTVNRKRKVLCRIKESVRAINKAEREFTPSIVKICPFGIERDKGHNIFPHW